MVSPELIRRYPFFAGLSHDQVVTLAMAANEEEAGAGHFFLHEGDTVPYLYLVVEGAVSVVIELPSHPQEISIAEVGSGEVFGWSALVPPHTAIASVKAAGSCRVVAIDCQKLLRVFEEDPRFGYIMMARAAQATRDRVAIINMETLAFLMEKAR